MNSIKGTSNPTSTSSLSFSFNIKHFSKFNDDVVGQHSNIENNALEKFEDIHQEVYFYLKIISTGLELKNFWSSYQNKLPTLAKLYRILENIEASGIFVEDLFSLSTFFNDLDLSNDWIRTKCLFKLNMNLLKEFSS
jgi:hypothetical protein